MKSLFYNQFIEKIKLLPYIKKSSGRIGEYLYPTLTIVVDKECENEFNMFINMYITESSGILYYNKINPKHYLFKYEDDFLFELCIEVFDDLTTNISDKDNLKVTPKLIGETINDLTFMFDKISLLIENNERLNAMSIVLDTYKLTIKFLSYYYNPNIIFQNYREALRDLPDLIKDYCSKIDRKLKIDTIQESSKMLFVLLDNHITKISINVAFFVNIDYYMHVKNKLFS